MVYLTGALLLNAIFIQQAWTVLKADDLKPAKKMFGFSIIYLFALFSCVLIDGVL